jgi:nicotinamidase/pyrazinamidase
MSTLFIDVDSQLDFVYPAGALYVPTAERIVPAIVHLNRYAAAHGIPVISTTDAHAENDPEFATWPKHCVAGTIGQRKPEATLLDRRVVAPHWVEGVQQIIVEKQTVDVFQARDLFPVLDRLNTARFVVYGVVTEICVLLAVRGLVKLGKPVTVVADAIESLTAEAGRAALDEMRAAGVTISATGHVTSH